MKDRKKYFASLEHRKSVTIRAGDIVVMEFYDGHFDFNTMRLMLPGFSLNAYKHWDGHQIRFRCLSRDDKKRVYYTVVFDLEHVGPGHSQAVDSDSPVSFEPAQEEFFHDGSEGEVTKNE